MLTRVFHPKMMISMTHTQNSDEIRIAQGEDVEWKQVVPMVLNLEDLKRSTIEVLEYEAERPLVEEVPAPAAVVHE